MTSRNFCFTINNYTKIFSDINEVENAKYLVFGKEVGESGTPHLQGYVEFHAPCRMAKACSRLGGKAHLEVRRGTKEQAINYCKKGGDWYEFGDPNGKQGERNDLAGLISEINDGVNKLDIMNNYTMANARYERFVNNYRAEIEKQKTKQFRNVFTEVLIGVAGCGKTRYVFEKEPNVFTVNAGETFPFDGYDGEDAILIDDFYGGIKYHEILRILDGYQYRVNVKGGHRYAQWTRVYITSNKPPSEWYSVGMTDALRRRLSVVTEVLHVTEVTGNNGPLPSE